MLKGISPLISPELLAVLARMGHGDEIILADAYFPGETFNGRVLRADGLRIPELLAAILPLFELDAYVPHPLVMMAAVPGDQGDHRVRGGGHDDRQPDGRPDVQGGRSAGAAQMSAGRGIVRARGGRR